MSGRGNGNATVPQGFEELKRALSVRYPEGTELSLRDFLNVESALALLVRICGLGADPSKADRLLSNYQLIRPGMIGPDEHLMQMARRHLFSLCPQPPGGAFLPYTNAMIMRLSGSSRPQKAPFPFALSRLPASIACRYTSSAFFAIAIRRIM